MTRWKSCASQPANAAERARLDSNGADLGYALLLKKITARYRQRNGGTDHASRVEHRAGRLAPVLELPHHGRTRLLFYRLVRGRLCARQQTAVDGYRGFLWVALLSLPLPWVAAELGWIVAEVGRQPWVIEGVLPTFLAVSSISAANVWITLDRLRGVLFDPCRGRCLLDGQDDQEPDRLQTRPSTARSSPRRRGRNKERHHVRL